MDYELKTNYLNTTAGLNGITLGSKKHLEKHFSPQQLQYLEKLVLKLKRVYSKIDYDPMTVLRYVHMAEKSVRAIETHNQLVFIVRKDADKKTIRDSMEAAFKEHVTLVRTMIDQKGRKKAFVT